MCIHLADEIVEVVGDIVVAFAVHSHGDGAGELRGEGRAVVTGVTGLGGRTGNGGGNILLGRSADGKKQSRAGKEHGNRDKGTGSIELAESGLHHFEDTAIVTPVWL